MRMALFVVASNRRMALLLLPVIMRMALLLFFPAEHSGVNPCTQLYTDKCIPQGEGITHDSFLLLCHMGSRRPSRLWRIYLHYLQATLSSCTMCVCARARKMMHFQTWQQQQQKEKKERERARERESTSWLRYVVPVGTGCSLPPPHPPNTSERARFKTPIVIIFIHRILLSSNKQLSDGGNWTSLRL